MKKTISNIDTRTRKRKLTVPDIERSISTIDFAALNDLFFSKVQPKEAGMRTSWETKREMIFSAEAAALYDSWMEHHDISIYLENQCHKDGKFPNESVWKLYLITDKTNDLLGDLFEKQFPTEYAFLTEEKE